MSNPFGRFAAIVLLLASVNFGCLGFHTSSGVSVKRLWKEPPPMLSLWEGEYGGNVKIESTEIQEKSSYPAHISIRQYSHRVVIKMNVPNYSIFYYDKTLKRNRKVKMNKVWSIKAQPYQFSTSALILSYQAVEGKSLHVYDINAALDDKHLTGYIKRGQFSQDGKLILHEHYTFDFVKIK